MKKLKKIYLVTILSILCQYSYAVDFNLDLLDSEDRNNIDLTKFTNKNYILPGKYLLDIVVNNKVYTQESVEYFEREDGEVRPCITSNLLNYFVLQEKIRKNIKFELISQADKNLSCAQIDDNLGIRITNAINEGRLKVNIPQLVMEPQYSGWTPYVLWSNGIPALILDYNINNSWRHSQSTEGTYSSSAYGLVGINIGAWRLRANYDASYYKNNQYNEKDSSEFNWRDIHAYRSIPKIHAVLSVGELYLNSNLFDSFRFRGIGLKTDERMLPPALRGYAPTISGIAKTNATVTIRQEGYVVHETTVPPGPFVIRDLSSALKGKMEITIKEEDGSTEVFEQYVESLPYLSRPGMLQYNLAIGEPLKDNHHTEGFKFFSGDFSYGIGNKTSLYGGSVLSSDYNAYALGIGRDLGVLGTASIDVTRSSAKLPEQPSQTGFSYRFSYSKKFDEYDSMIQFAGYRFSEEKFTTMAQYMNAWQGHRNFQDLTSNSDFQDENRDFDLDNYLRKDKEFYTVSLSKTFFRDDKKKNFNAYLSYSYQTFWNDTSQKRLNLSLSKSWEIKKRYITTMLNLYQNKNGDQDTKGFMLSISLPLDSKRYVSLSSQYEKDYHSNSLNYYQTFDNLDSLSMTFSNTNNDNNLSTYYRHKASMADISLSGSVSDNQDYNAALRLQGGLTLSRYGFVMHPIQNLGQTRILVDAGNAKGVTLQDSNAKTNFMGLTVVDASSYYNKDAKIDFNKLPDNVEANDSVRSLTLTEGGVGYVKFDVLTGEKHLFQIKYQNNYPPFGAVARNDEGREIGIVSDSGIAYLMGLKAGRKVDIVWGDDKCTFQIPKIDKSISMIGVDCH